MKKIIKCLLFILGIDLMNFGITYDIKFLGYLIIIIWYSLVFL